MPGARLDDIASAEDVVTDQAKADTLYVINAGTNDIQISRNDDYLRKYRRVIRFYKNKSRHVILSGILPRINALPSFYNRPPASTPGWNSCATKKAWPS